ncbi:MAG TPA: flagellar type III secretion system protein FlhB [Acetobacteraceae bacterium]|nr:flagellar type III secretion system protein FlhB [Acetobacteraceae bacterium]
MADAEGAGGDRTEAPTGRRLQRAREAGQAPISQELAVLAVLASSTLMLAMTAPSVSAALSRRLAVFLTRPDLPNGLALRLASLAAFRAAAPLVGAALLAGAGAVLLQSGFMVSATPLRPDLHRISPAAGLRRLLGPQSAIEAMKSLVKLAVTGAVLWEVIAADVPRLMAAPFRDPHMLGRAALAPAVHVLMAVLGVQAAIAIMDLVQVRLRHARDLRMSRIEVRDELKETEGDPKVKLRFKRLRLQRARRRMLAAVPKATVVVTNPTHYAVALAYDRARNAAPRVVAKGVDSMAARIREVAETHRVPLAVNPPLARALYRLEVDTDIPPEHYKAVAGIIAYVWRLRGHATGLAAAAAG